jgi:predicted Zn-dependent protease
MKKYLLVIPLLILIGLLGLSGYLVGRHFWIGHHQRAAQLCEEQRRFAEAERHLARCRSACPDDPVFQLASARVARRAGRLDDAQAFLTRSRELSADSEAVFLEAALLRVQGGHPGDWENYLWSRVLNEDKSQQLILEALALGNIKTFRFEQALHCLDVWIKGQDDAQALCWRGQIKLDFDNVSEAEEDFKRALELDPEHREARLALANILLGHQAPGEALAEFKRVQEQDPEERPATLGVARCLRDLGEAEQALVLVEGLLSKEPDQADYQGEMGQILFGMGRFSEAEVWLRKAHDKLRLDSTITYTLSQCLLKLGHKDEADVLIAFKKLVDSDIQRHKQLMMLLAEHPNQVEPRQEIGEILLRAGYDKEALQWFQSALALDPYFVPTHKALANYYAGKNNSQLAEEHRRMAQGD